MEGILNEENPAGATGWELLQWGFRIKADPLKTYLELHEVYGDIVWMPWPGKKCLFLYHPDHVGHVLKDNHTNYLKGDQYEDLKPLLGEGLLTSEGELWRNERRVMAKQFHAPAIAGYSAVVRELSQKKLENLSGTVNIAPVFNRLALDIAGQIFFGAEVDRFSAEISEGLSYEMEKVVERIRSAFSFPLAVPTPENLRRRKILRAMNRVVEDIMDHPDPGKINVLTSLMSSGEIPRKQIRDEVMTLLMAGHETTSNLLTWIIWYLALHPSWQEELRKELRDTGKRAAEFAPMDLKLLPKFTAVMNETLRLMPPVPAVARMAKAEDVIGGVKVPAGTTVVCQQWVTHRDPRWWKEPGSFNPERFVNRPDRKDDFTFFPFARGPRGCIGEELARAEAVLIMAAFLERYRWGLEPGFTPLPVHHLTLQSKNGMRIELRPV